MTQRAADDFAAIRRRMEELTAEEELKHAPERFETDTGDEHTIAVQPSTGKRYKWINGQWTEEEYSLPNALEYYTGWQDCAEQYYAWYDANSPYIEHQSGDERPEVHTLLDYMI